MSTPSVPIPLSAGPDRPASATTSPTRCSRAAVRVTATLVLFLAACAGGDAAHRMTTATDTFPNGATLVRHTPPADGVPVTWRLDEELRIGTMDGGGPAQFGRVGGLEVADDGRIIVLDAQAQDIRVFDADGRHVGTLGRKGAGPGEMEGANAVVLGPDGILRVPDARNTRISFFDLDRGYLRSHPYNPMFTAWLWGGVVDRRGATWSIHWIPPDGPMPPGGGGRLAYVGYDTAGVPIDTLPHPETIGDTGRDDPGLWTVEGEAGRARAALAVPFYPRREDHLEPRVRVWSTTRGDPEYRLTRWTPGGDTTLVLETARPLQPVDRAAADSIVSEWETRVNARLDRSKIPQLAPAIIDFFVDDDDRLWVLARTADSDSIRTLDAYDADDGRWLGTLATHLPIVTRPRPVIRGDRVWAVVQDELDVPYVMRGSLIDAGEEARVVSEP